MLRLWCLAQLTNCCLGLPEAAAEALWQLSQICCPAILPLWSSLFHRAAYFLMEAVSLGLHICVMLTGSRSKW